jgi:Ca2+-binding EF-hand superfamily protein
MNKYLVIAAAAASVFASQAGAQSPPTSPQAPVAGERGGGMNRDLTRQGAAQRAQTAFQRLDLNGDGTLTHDEAQQAAAQFMAQRGGGDTSRIDARIDRMFNGAQSVTLQQYEQESLARFDRQDLNHDGVVTAAEREQGREAR